MLTPRLPSRTVFGARLLIADTHLLQRNPPQSELNNAERFEEGKENSHMPNDSSKKTDLCIVISDPPSHHRTSKVGRSQRFHMHATHFRICLILMIPALGTNATIHPYCALPHAEDVSVSIYASFLRDPRPFTCPVYSCTCTVGSVHTLATSSIRTDTKL